MASKKKIADAVSTLVDAITESTTTTEETAGPKTRKTYLAIYQQNVYNATYDDFGKRIEDAAALKAYYKKYPNRDPDNWSIIKSHAQLPRFVVEVKDGDFKAAREKIESALDGLKLLSGTDMYYDDPIAAKTRYHVVEITEEV